VRLKSDGFFQNCSNAAIHQYNADKFKDIYKNTDWKWQLDYGRKMGIGYEEYEIINLT
jgi:uncharacterized Fe-S center protein